MAALYPPPATARKEAKATERAKAPDRSGSDPSPAGRMYAHSWRLTIPPRPCVSWARHNHSATPPCREQVPDRVWLDEYVPSLHFAVAPSGADAALTGRSTQFPFALT